MPARSSRTALHLAATLVAAAILLPSAAGAELAAGAHTLAAAGQEVSFRAAAPAGSILDISLIQGNVQVEPAAGGEVEVVARRAPTDAPPIRVLWLPEDGRLVACTSYRSAGAASAEDCALGRERQIEGPPNAARVDFAVRLPPGMALRARTVNGDVLVAGFRGAVTAHSVTGRVELRGGSGAVDARSVSGDLEIHEVRATRLTAETTSGAIAWSGAASAGDDLRLQSYSGEIRLQPAAGSDASLEVTTGTGRLSTRLAADRLEPDDTGRRRYRLVLGAGAASLRAVTHSGNVVVTPPAE